MKLRMRPCRMLLMVLVCVMLLGTVPIYADDSDSGNDGSTQNGMVYTNPLSSATDLSDFKAYYAKDARKGLIETPFSEDWTISEKGVMRLAKPHGIGGYWQSNNDGTGEYGYPAELVYTVRRYMDFELEVDAMQVAESIGRGIGIGFGKTKPGAFFVDSDNMMQAAGGAYAYVKRGGETAIWGYAQNTVNAATGKLGNNGRQLGTAVTGGSACSTWHTIKVRVEDSKVSMWIKAQGAKDSTYQQVINEVALKDYKGGYISLMTNANGAFANLVIRSFDEEVLEDGTISLPLNRDKNLSGFTSYYAKNAKEGLAETALSEDWTISEKGVMRLAKPHGIGGYWQSNNDGTGEYGYLAELVYTVQQYVDFELEVDAMQVAESISRGIGIGFGKAELGAFFVDNDSNMKAAGGAYAYVKRGGETAIWGYAQNTVNAATGKLGNNGRQLGTAVSGGSACSTWHTIKVRVEDSKVSMWIKAQGAEDSTYQQVINEVALKDYKGGYISLMTNANGAFKNLKIKAMIIGDLNDDGIVNVIDLVLMKKAEAGIIAVTEQNDIVNDGVVDHWDLLRLRRIILGITEWDDSISNGY